MLNDYAIYGPLAFVLVVAVGVGALWYVRSSRAVHEQQRQAWKAYQAWLDSGPTPLSEAGFRHGLPLARPRSAHS
jgi:hypothetical protein